MTTDTTPPKRKRAPKLAAITLPVVDISTPAEKSGPTISPTQLAQATTGVKAVTSMAMATAHPVDPAMYSGAEKSAARTAHALDYGLNRNSADALSFVEATGWPGFQSLALLAQLPEYRTMHETLADEVVRTWGQVVSTSKDEASAEKIPKIAQKLESLKVRSLVRTAVIHDQAFGGAHVFPHLTPGGVPLKTDVPLLLRPAFVKPDCLDGLACIEPMWLSPMAYNANDPTQPNFYRPETWLATSGKQIHHTRIFTMISRPVGDILKAAYSFRGVSISQLAMPYVDNWLRTRQSVSDTVKQFSVTYLAADLAQMLSPGGEYSLLDRAQLFNLYRDNRNLALIDKATEEFGSVNTPLSGLDALQAQSQEQMSAVSHIPLVKLLGITPAGLNANSDGEIRVWYDFVAGYQAHNATPLMLWILQLVQLDLFGEIDPGLSWDWAPLYELTDLELADVRYKNADTDVRYMEAGVLAGEDVQQRLANDPTSGYSGIMAERDELDEVNALAEKIAREAAAEPAEPDGVPEDEPSAGAA